MNVLFYYPSNKQSNSLETLLEELSKRNVTITLLTTCSKGVFHERIENLGIKTFTNALSNKSGIIYYLKQIIFLVLFCQKHKIDVVCSHLQHANFISVFAQLFLKTKFIIFRHHFQFNMISNDSVVKVNRNERLFDKIINRLAKTIVVPSHGVYNGVIQFESIKKSKLFILPYIYNFDNYSKPNLLHVMKIEETYPCQMRLLMCSRLIELKRHYLVFPIIRKLVNEGFDIKLIVLDDGPEKENLLSYIKNNQLESVIFLLGFKTDFIDYMAACDLMIHPSLSDASNSAVKEMGLLSKTVAVCSQVGDFDEYIINEVNGFLMSPINTEVEIESIIRKAYFSNNLLMKFGENLKEKVFLKFNRSKVIVDAYLKLFDQLQN